MRTIRFKWHGKDIVVNIPNRVYGDLLEHWEPGRLGWNDPDDCPLCIYAERWAETEDAASLCPHCPLGREIGNRDCLRVPGVRHAYEALRRLWTASEETEATKGARRAVAKFRQAIIDHTDK